jgi:hypothetical protein
VQQAGGWADSDEVSVRVPQVAADLRAAVDRRRDELWLSISPSLIRPAQTPWTGRNGISPLVAAPASSCGPCRNRLVPPAARQGGETTTVAGKERATDARPTCPHRSWRMVGHPAGAWAQAAGTEEALS